MEKYVRLKSNLLLLLAAAIWGFAFVAQRNGMDYIGPFTFSGVRFALGSLSVLPLIFFFKINSHNENDETNANAPSSWRIGFMAGLLLFCGVSLQQVGLQYTTIAKASFITSLYIVIVPIIGIFLHQHITNGTWCGCILAAIGLYLLCIKKDFAISYGDFLELMGAFFWAAHLLFLDHFARKIDTFKFAFFQFMACSFLSMITALSVEKVAINTILQASVPLLYTGICSTAIAYTLQIFGQKNADPSHAALILSMETVFAPLGGYFFFGEQLEFLEVIGCIFMLSGILVTQLQNITPEQNDTTDKYMKKDNQPSKNV